MSVLNASVGISSGPGALLFFRCFMCLIISSLAGLSHLMDRSTSAGGSSGTGLFRSSSKCSAHVVLLLSSHDAPSLLVFNGSFRLAILTC